MAVPLADSPHRTGGSIESFASQTQETPRGGPTSPDEGAIDPHGTETA
jgi:hypothetical protein